MGSSGQSPLDLYWLDDDLAIYRYPADADIEWPNTGLVSVTRTPSEVSVILPSAATAPEGWQNEAGPFRAFAVQGPLDLSMTGVLAALAVPLAEAGVPIFALSTYDTDYVLVAAQQTAQCELALVSAGHRFG